MDRAYSLLEIKSIDRAARVISGIASTPTVDRGGDVMVPSGAEFTLPMPLLWQHGAPIGEVFDASVTPTGIFIKAQIATVSTPGRVRDRLEEAWQSISSKPPLVRGLSIGWSPIKSEPIPGTPFRRVLRWIWGELSAVVVPMNAEATITSVKHFDAHRPAVSGTGPAVAALPGVPGSSQITIMNYSEQLTAERAALQTKSTRLQELITNEQAHGSLDEAESQEKDTLLTDVPAITAKVKNLAILEAAQAAQAGTITIPAHDGTAVRNVQRIDVVKKEYPKGTLFARYAMAVAAGKGSISDTMSYAKRFTDTPEVLAYVKATEGVATLNSPSWGSQLVNPSTIATEFVDLVRAATIIGRVPGFRNVPFNIPIITQTGGSTFGWVGEGGVKPVGELAFDRTTLGNNKVAGIIVLTEELIRLSSPDAEATVRTDLTEQCARFIDEQFIQVSVSAGANNPASITNGVSSPAATGADLASLMADLNTALATFDSAGITTDGLVIVTTPAIARGISMLTNPLGQAPAGFNMTPNGGTLLGYPVIVSASVDSGTVVIFKPSEIFLADDGRVTLDASNQATLDMSGGSPVAPTFNLWQRNCVGIRAERWITWQPRRSGAVAVIDTASYGPSVGSP